MYEHGVTQARGSRVYLCEVSCRELGYVSALASCMSDNLKDKIENAADKAKDIAEKAGERIKHGAEKVADKVKSGADKVEDRGRDLGKKVGG